MPTQAVIYQQSPQFLARACLYLENLFAFIQESASHSHPIMHYDALKNIIKILHIIEKPELKSRFSKEFIRLEHTLSKTLKLDNPELWGKFIQKSSELQNLGNRFTCNLNQDPFLQSIKLRQSNQEQNFELPPTQIYYWLHQDAKLRQHIIKDWIDSLLKVQSFVQIYLSILRRHAEFERIDIKDNFLYQAFGQTPLPQLLMLKIPNELTVFPKIQLANHTVSIHFNDPSNIEEPSRYSAFVVDLAIVKL